MEGSVGAREVAEMQQSAKLRGEHWVGSTAAGMAGAE